MPTQHSQPNLLVSRVEASKSIMQQIKSGGELRDRKITSRAELDAAKTERERWVSYTTELLRRSFDNAIYAEEFERASASRLIRAQAPISMQANYFSEIMAAKVVKLQGILERLPLIPEAQPDVTPNARTLSQRSVSDVFVVHGRDLATKNELARFIEKLGLKAVILDEQPSQGRTIIEKFEHYADSVGFAVVLFTPDDVTALRNTAEEEHVQARPNVLFELGYFVARLGRGRVCLLRKGQTNIPSDLFGIVYVSLDKGNWQVELAKEMQGAELPVDLNKLLQ